MTQAKAVLARLRDGEVGDPFRELPWWHWPVLACWAAHWFSVMLTQTKHGRGWNPSWHFSASGARLLFGGSAHGGGLSLFAHHPNLQSGPLTFILAAPITPLGAEHGLYAAQIIMMTLGLLLLFALERAALAYRTDVDPSRIRWTILGGGLALLPVWALAAVYWGHFDDVLALLFSVLALWSVAVRKPLLVGLFVALAVDSKPWAAGFLPLVLAVPGGWSWREPRLRALGLAVLLIAALWLPFVLGDSQTLSSLSNFSIRNTPDSALRALGINDPGTPSWDRPAQILLGCVLGSLAVWRRRWPAVVLVGVCARLILEPNDYPYYYAGLIIGALAWDLLASKRPTPLFTVGVTAVIFGLVPLAGLPNLKGTIKLWAMIAMVVVVLVGPAVRGLTEWATPTRKPAEQVPVRAGAA
jgi:hypothetical protein